MRFVRRDSMKKITALFCAILLLIIPTGCSSQKTAASLLDKNGNLIASIDKLDFSDERLQGENYRSYAEAVLTEAIEILAEKEQVDNETAARKLLTEGYVLKTEFNKTAFDAIAAMEEIPSLSQAGCAILDKNSAILAISGVGDARNGNTKVPPYSTIKPLAVYAPAMEKGIISWSTGIPDTPFSKITDDRGNTIDWPVNPSNSYTYRKVSLIECIKQSLNTTSVHTAKDLGVEKSIDFLTESFGLDLGFERNKLALEGENEVIGNVALGYLKVGLTPSQLAGCYQIFARDGKYIKPHTISSITDKDGKTVYTYAQNAKQVISPETAYIMNRLLTGVVSPGGTGEKAKVEGSELIGKTGTGSENEGNWFVGVTPNYSCALWHSSIVGAGNLSAELFTKIMKKMPSSETKEFSAPNTVRKGVFCSESGKIFSSSCKRMQIGYYVQADKPDICDAH